MITSAIEPEITTAILDKSQEGSFPMGVWPVAVTPFKTDGAIDWNAYDQLIEWYIEKGCAGIFTVCLSSEFFNLTNDEMFKLARRAVERSNGRIPVLAGGGLGKNIDEVIKSVITMSGTYADTVIIPLNQLAQADESEDVIIKNIDKLLSQTGDIKLGVYECPVPYHRLFSTELLKYCADTGRFYFLKDTCCNAATIGHRLDVCKGTSLSIYNANITTLMETMAMGCCGYDGPAANFYPDLIDKMIRCRESDPAKAAMLEKIVLCNQRTVAHKYLRAAKIHLKLCGLDITDYCRQEMPEYNWEDYESLKAFHSLLEMWQKEYL